MASSISTDWLEERIAKTKALIEAYEDAILALSSGAQSYTLDTGQTRQTVTKAQLSQLSTTLDRLEGRLQRLIDMRCGAGTYVRPGF